jgi:phage tail tape-measure protein
MAKTNDKTGLERAKNTEHVLVDVGTVSGAVTGAVVGIVAGAPGILVGGAIGAALGTMAGAVLDRESHSGEKHERELDDAIGVTNGDIGAGEAVRASFASKQEMSEAHRRALEAELEPTAEEEAS